MKTIIGVAVTAACLSIAYYFSVFLPSHQNQIASQLRTLQNNNPGDSKVELEMQLKCAQMSKDLFYRIGYDEKKLDSYECHYSRKSSKFYMTIHSVADDYENTLLIDVIENKSMAEYMRSLKDSWPPRCEMHGKPSTLSYEEFNTFLKNYMEQ